MGSKYLLDSNIAIYLLNGTLKGNEHPVLELAIKDIPRISVISKIELLGWIPPDKAEIEKIVNFIEHSFVYGLSEEIVDKTIEIRKLKRIKLPDAMIAATAIVNECTLLTRNTADFTEIPNLNFFNPFGE